MSVDLWESRFRTELRKVDRFEPQGAHDPRVWEADFPAWRALFSSLCLYGHSTGYRLFSYEDFWRYCHKAYAVQHPKKERFARFFEGELLPGMRQRVGTWYESGMAETYLYVCLVQAIEDESKCGAVLYDSRVDWKLKADAVVLCNNHAFRICAFFDALDERAGVEQRRDDIERERKKNTNKSAHWGNDELPQIPRLNIARDDPQVVNGVRLFSLRSVNQLLREIYQASGVEGGWLFGKDP